MVKAGRKVRVRVGVRIGSEKGKDPVVKDDRIGGTVHHPSSPVPSTQHLTRVKMGATGIQIRVMKQTEIMGLIIGTQVLINKNP